MKKIGVALAFSLMMSSSLAFAKAETLSRGDSGLPTLKGGKAADLLQILEKTKAIQGSCTADNCYKRGELDVQCKSASNKGSDVSTICTLTAAGKSRPVVSLDATKSKRMINLLEATQANGEGESCEGMGACHQKGSLAVDCQYPAGKNAAKEFSCAISAAPKKGSPRVVVPDSSGNR